MHRIIILVVGLLLFIDTSGQELCDITRISKQEQEILENFCVKLKNAVNSKDVKQLSSLCNFPLRHSFLVRTPKDDYQKFVKISRKKFEKTQHRLLLSEYLIEKLNKGNPIELLSSQTDSSGVKCYYFFSYPINRSNNPLVSQQGYLQIEKIGEKYKIVSIWTIP